MRAYFIPIIRQCKSQAMPKVASRRSRTTGSKQQGGKQQGDNYAKDLVGRLTTEYTKNQDPVRAVKSKQYLRGKFECCGLYSPQRRAIDKLVISEFDAPTLDQLKDTMTLAWQEEFRECQAFAIDFGKKHRKLLAGDDVKSAKVSLTYLKTLITNKSWWDTVDLMASWLVGYVVMQHRSECVSVMDEWIQDEDLWVRRTAILHQLGYKKDVDSKLLFGYCLQCADEEDFFIRKAIGWGLRECYKVQKSAVKTFVNKNREQLSNLSIKEALKHD